MGTTTTEAAAAAAGTSMASCSLHAFVSGRRQAQGSVAGILAESEVMTGRLANGRWRLPLREEEDKDSSRAGSLLGSVLGFAKPNEAYGKQRGSYGGSAGQKYFGSPTTFRISASCTAWRRRLRRRRCSSSR